MVEAQMAIKPLEVKEKIPGGSTDGGDSYIVPEITLKPLQFSPTLGCCSAG
jgi:hypothetical protein